MMADPAAVTVTIQEDTAASESSESGGEKHDWQNVTDAENISARKFRRNPKSWQHLAAGEGTQLRAEEVLLIKAPYPALSDSKVYRVLVSGGKTYPVLKVRNYTNTLQLDLDTLN